jgi:Fuc2NAc and GlcNAc transferase
MNDAVGTALACAIAACLSAGLAEVIRLRAIALGLIAVPNERSSHEVPTPQGGGAGVGISATATSLWLTRHEPDALLWLLSMAAVLGAMGWLDDVRNLSVRWRLLVQAGTVVGLFAWLGAPAYRFDSSGLTWAVAGLVVVSIVWWINLFNFMDGIDGLAAAQAVCMLVLATAIALVHGAPVLNSPVWLLAMLTSCACLGFLALNWPPARIFMGDSGSLWLAFVIVSIALVSVKRGDLHPVSWLILGGVFICDATSTLIIRMLRGEKWTQPHRAHAYQRLSSRSGKSRAQPHKHVTVGVLLINVAWLGPLAALNEQLPQLWPLWLLTAWGPIVAAVLKAGAGKAPSSARSERCPR